jgi:thioredoxin-related protein
VSELEKQYEGKVKIVMLNVDNPVAASAVQKYRVRGTPTFVLFDKKGKITTQAPGWPGREQLAKAFDQLLAQNRANP